MENLGVDAYDRFASWFYENTGDDPTFTGHSAEQWLRWCEKHDCIDELLGLERHGRHFREWWSINYHQTEENPFPDVRRKGGDHDRGFSPALNAEMQRRNQR